MIVVTGSFVARPDRLAEAVALAQEHVNRSRLEPGCISHALHLDAENPNRLFFFGGVGRPGGARRPFPGPRLPRLRQPGRRAGRRRAAARHLLGRAPALKPAPARVDCAARRARPVCLLSSTSPRLHLLETGQPFIEGRDRDMGILIGASNPSIFQKTRPELHFRGTEKLARSLPAELVYNWLQTTGFYPEPYVLPPSFKVTKPRTFGKTCFSVNKDGRYNPAITQPVNVQFPKSDWTDRIFGIIDPRHHGDMAQIVAENWENILNTVFHPEIRIYSYSFPIPVDSENPRYNWPIESRKADLRVDLNGRE